MKFFVLIPLYLIWMFSETNFATQQEEKRKKTEIAVMEFILSEKSLELYRLRELVVTITDLISGKEASVKQQFILEE